MSDNNSAHWDDLRFVLMIARAGSIKKAAKLLRSTESTVSRRLVNAEQQLSVSLFERQPSGMQPTPACQQLIHHLEQADSAVEAGINAARALHMAPEGLVRLTAVPTLMNHIIIPVLGDFLAGYPGITIELIASPAELSILHREVDIAVRFSQPSREPDAITRKLGTLFYGVYELRQNDGSEIRPWIDYEQQMAHLPQSVWMQQRIQQFGEPAAALRVNDADSMIAALQAGYGKSLLPEWIGDRYPLLHEVPYPDLPAREVWLLLHPNTRMTRRIRVVVDWLERIFREP